MVAETVRYRENQNKFRFGLCLEIPQEIISTLKSKSRLNTEKGAELWTKTPKPDSVLDTQLKFRHEIKAE